METGVTRFYMIIERWGLKSTHSPPGFDRRQRFQHFKRLGFGNDNQWWFWSDNQAGFVVVVWWSSIYAIYRSWHFGSKSVFSIRCGFVIRVGWSAVQIFVLVWDSCSNSCPPPPCCCIKRKKRATAEKAAEKCRKCEKAGGKCGSLDPPTLPDVLVATELEISRKVNQLKPKDWLCNVIT